MINLYNTSYFLEKEDKDFKLYLLLNGSCYIPNVIDKFTCENGSVAISLNDKKFSDIASNQFIFKFSVNDRPFVSFDRAVNQLEIGRKTAMDRDLSTLRFELLNDIKNNYGKLIVANDGNILPGKLRIFKHKIILKKTVDPVFLESIVDESERKHYFLYNVYIHRENTNEIIYKLQFLNYKRVFFVEIKINENLAISDDYDRFLRTIYHMLGVGITSKEYEEFLKNQMFQSVERYIEDGTKDYIENIKEARDIFSKRLLKTTGKFILSNGEIKRIKINFNGEINSSNINATSIWLSEKLNEFITIRDVMNYVK